ncbi:hypothetical protein ONZ45_g18243 [Pleurotus djamor]|nr:hypothetical protein ONZ45_g18243 [Pleurotus djamor]
MSNLTNLLANKQAGQSPTPIPPSLQARMAAMVTRGSGPPPDGRDPNRPPDLRAANSYPPASPAFRNRGGSTMAGRRLKPGFTLKDIDPTAIPTPSTSGGAQGAGLGAGRPLPNNTPRRPPPTSIGTPFSNFSKIVHISFQKALMLRYAKADQDG